jgi:Rod binding domain-containing protein
MTDQISLQNVPLSFSNLKNVGHSDDQTHRRMKEACSELESLFIYYLLKEMRETVPKDGLFSGGKTEEMYTSMFDIQLAKEIAMKRGIGISSIVLNQVEKGAGSHGYSNGGIAGRKVGDTSLAK